MIVYTSLVVAIVGLLMYLICTQPKPEKIGLVLFACGTLAFLLSGVQHVVGLLK